MAGIDQDRVAGDSGGGGPLGERDGPSEDVGDHVVVRHPVRAGPWLLTAGVRADVPRSAGRGDVDEQGVDPTPGIVDQIGTRVAGDVGDLVPPGVHADHQVRVPVADSGHERRRPADLLGGVDVLAGAGLDTADVDDGRPLGDGAFDRFERRCGCVRRAAVVEGVRGAVDDGHDHELVDAEGARTQPQLHSVS